MSEETKQAIRTVVDYLDSVMEEKPDRPTADCSNYLEELLSGSNE